ncbi:hypothetical protein AB0G79_09925 [Streptomyces sp. NPDC020807]|uniref:hypothetical protein n=1 Tax=Streptomyces sp. NPDC020807 TaxID=3155119 RepID=UPI0033E3B1BF
MTPSNAASADQNRALVARYDNEAVHCQAKVTLDRFKLWLHSHSERDPVMINGHGRNYVPSNITQEANVVM